MYKELAYSPQEAAEIEATSELVAMAVVHHALPLCSLEPDSTRRTDFYEHMGIKHLEFGEYYDDQTRVLVANDTNQESGAFKSRGAANAAMMTNAHTLTAASAGNHGNGVAIAGLRLGKHVVIEAAESASPVKIAKMRTNQAEVHAVHASVDEAMPVAQDRAASCDVAFVHPYDDINVIAGQATVGFDMLDKLLADQQANLIDLTVDPVTVFVPIGGGGLITGVASVFAWAKEMGLAGEQLHVVGVQMEGCDAMRRSVEQLQGLRAPGELFSEAEFKTACDGTAVTNVGSLALLVAADKQFVHDIITVSEAELGTAMQHLEELHGKRIEPAGALSMAGAQKLRGGNNEVQVTLTSGCNVSDETWNYFMRATETSTGLRTSRTCNVASAVMLRRMVEPPRPVQEIASQDRRDIMDEYYDSLEESGVYLIRRY